MKFKPTYKQLTIDGFRSSLDGLDKANRWVWLGDHLPWEEFDRRYKQTLNNQKFGAGAKPTRMVIAALIIKHVMRLSDVDTISIIRENPYMQYMCGLAEFTDQPIFDPSLFVDLRKRISNEDINEMTDALLKHEQEMREEARKREEEEARSRGDEPPAAPSEDPDAKAFVDSKGREHKGILKVDATCADAEVRYPVDVDIIDDGCRVIDRFIRRICKKAGLTVPYTYYGKARHAYTYLVKMKKKGGKLVKDTIGLMLGYLHRDILTLMDLTAGENRSRLEYLRKDQRRVLEATMRMYSQQEQMHRTGEHRCGYSKPLGRPPKEPPSPERQAAMARAAGQRNEVECSFGTGKRVYQANDIRAKLPDTAECWTGMCYFAKNVMKFLRELCHDFF